MIRVHRVDLTCSELTQTGPCWQTRVTWPSKPKLKSFCSRRFFCLVHDINGFSDPTGTWWTGGGSTCVQDRQTGDTNYDTGRIHGNSGFQSGSERNDNVSCQRIPPVSPRTRCKLTKIIQHQQYHDNVLNCMSWHIITYNNSLQPDRFFTFVHIWSVFMFLRSLVCGVEFNDVCMYFQLTIVEWWLWSHISAHTSHRTPE